jgi:hypothetical protein
MKSQTESLEHASVRQYCKAGVCLSSALTFCPWQNRQ